MSNLTKRINATILGLAAWALLTLATGLHLDFAQSTLLWVVLMAVRWANLYAERGRQETRDQDAKAKHVAAVTLAYRHGYLLGLQHGRPDLSD